MRIAVTSEGPTLDHRVDPRFGRCRYFLIANSETMAAEAVENPNISLGNGAGIQSSLLIIDRGVDVVLTGNCGPNAFQVLDEAGVKVVVGVSGSGRKAVDAFKQGSFRPTAGPNVAGHSGLAASLEGTDAEPAVANDREGEAGNNMGRGMGQGRGGGWGGGMGRGRGGGMGQGRGGGMGQGRGGGMGQGRGGGMGQGRGGGMGQGRGGGMGQGRGGGMRQGRGGGMGQGRGGGMGQGRGGGMGRGRGGGMGQGRGGGMGQGRGGGWGEGMEQGDGGFGRGSGYDTDTNPVTAGDAPQELDLLKAQARSLGEQLNAVAARIQEMERGRKEAAAAVEAVEVNPELCDGCGDCIEVCPEDAISLNGVAQIDPQKCVCCETCVAACPKEALSVRPV